MKTTLIPLTSFAALTVAGLCQAKPPHVPAEWKTECIGYFNRRLQEPNATRSLN